MNKDQVIEYLRTNLNSTSSTSDDELIRKFLLLNADTPVEDHHYQSIHNQYLAQPQAGVETQPLVIIIKNQQEEKQPNNKPFTSLNPGGAHTSMSTTGAGLTDKEHGKLHAYLNNQFGSEKANKMIENTRVQIEENNDDIDSTIQNDLVKSFYFNRYKEKGGQLDPEVVAILNGR